MTGQLLDLFLVVGVGVFLYSGYRQGLLVGFLSFAGLLGGGLAGSYLAPIVSRNYLPGEEPAMVALLCVMILASLGQILASGLGFLLKDKVTWEPARAVDALGGALLSATAVLIVAWIVGTAVIASPYRAPAEAARGSFVLAVVDGVMPTRADQQLSALRRLVDTSGFPQVIDAFGDATPAEIDPPDPALAAVPGVLAAEPAIARITGTAPSCGQALEGTGFVYAPERIMTNAHVVAGVREPMVEINGESRPATIVHYDPRKDLAVLRVEGLTVTPLPFSPDPGEGADAVAVGFPEGGSFTASPGRIRRTLTLDGPDIYQRQQVQREVFELRVIVRPGNSGGPLVAPDGSVYGVIFANSPVDGETGYALTLTEVTDVAAAGASATEPVSSQDCS